MVKPASRAARPRRTSRPLDAVACGRTGVRAAVRAGRVRASFHAYTTEADVDLALDALRG